MQLFTILGVCARARTYVGYFTEKGRFLQVEIMKKCYIPGSGKYVFFLNLCKTQKSEPKQHFLHLVYNNSVLSQ